MEPAIHRAAKPNARVQLLRVTKQWRHTHAKAAISHWQPEPLRLWQVRLPNTAGAFSRDGICCAPPCQPLLDRDEPWHPIEHDISSLSTDVLWHRVVRDGVWEGRWEQLGALRLGNDHFVVRNVPFLADDVCVSDVVLAPEEAGGRRVIHRVVQQSLYRTVQIECEATDDAGRARVDEALKQLAEDDDVAWECSHWHRRHWTVGVAASRLEWAEELLRPLLRDGIVGYGVVQRAG